MSLEKTPLPLTQAAIFSFFEADCQSYLIQSHILLISKLHICKSRKNKFVSSTCSLKETSKIKNIEKKIAFVKEKKTLHVKESGEKFKKNCLKKMITLLYKYKKDSKIMHEKVS